MSRYRSLITRWPLMALLLLSLLMLPLLDGCRDNGQATPTPTKTPKTTATDGAVTATPHSPTATPTPLVTPTTRPSATPTPMPPTATPTPIPSTPTPNLYARPEDVNPLTGLVVDDPAKLQRRPFFVVINNAPPARSLHYGFGEEELVYEFMMERHAVTRFTAVFLAGKSEQIGPVRSARLINFYLTPQYGGALVASGAGQDVRWWMT